MRAFFHPPQGAARFWVGGLALLLIGLAFALARHHRPEGAGTPSSTAAEEQSDEAHLITIGQPREVNAAWYDVPDNSLAKRRAPAGEMTAAHNKLPLGTLARVTHLKNGKNVLVRITDRGIHDRKVQLDLCREAARELEMVSKGVARVRMEIVAEEGNAPAGSQAATPEPSAKNTDG